MSRRRFVRRRFVCASLTSVTFVDYTAHITYDDLVRVYNMCCAQLIEFYMYVDYTYTVGSAQGENLHGLGNYEICWIQITDLST